MNFGTVRASRPWMAICALAVTMGSGSAGALAQDLQGVELASCHATSGGAGRARAPGGDPRSRAAAQRALDFLGTEVSRWQEQHQCYGCHVQAVTLEAFVVGRHHDYRVPEPRFETVMQGMLDLPGGAHDPNGLSYRGGSLLEPSNAFGGAAFAHFDERIGPRVRDELLAAAQRLEGFQLPDGRVGDYANGPVAQGTIQGTTQAMQTWRQAYARTADERWLRPIRLAEDWLQGQAQRLSRDGGSVQHMNFAVMGLVAAGASGTETVLRALGDRIRGTQQANGSFGGPLETGQTLYTLRLLGAGDDDPQVRRGTAWLIGQQAADGGWGHGGASRGTAMWGVLGLVSIAVASIDLDGVADGQHVRGPVTLRATATDNTGRGIRRVDIRVDDVPIASTCGATAGGTVDLGGLPTGPHVVDVVATTSDRRVSRRRVTVYSGDHFLTSAAARWVGDATQLSFRNVAPRDVGGQVRVRVFATREQGGQRVRAAQVFQHAQPSRQGPIQVRWPGADRGRYVAEVAFVDETGRARQTLEVPFVHDTPEARHAEFGQVAGSITVDADAAEQAEVELLDGEGRVVARTRSTRSGQYRFQDVQRGRYQVRVRRRGAVREAPVQAAPAAEASADFAF